MSALDSTTNYIKHKGKEIFILSENNFFLIFFQENMQIYKEREEKLQPFSKWRKVKRLQQAKRLFFIKN